MTVLNVELSVLEWLKPSELALIALFLCRQKLRCPNLADIFPEQWHRKEERDDSAN
jgi:hypothetical protein